MLHPGVRVLFSQQALPLSKHDVWSIENVCEEQ